MGWKDVCPEEAKSQSSCLGASVLLAYGKRDRKELHLEAFSLLSVNQYLPRTKCGAK